MVWHKQILSIFSFIFSFKFSNNLELFLISQYLNNSILKKKNTKNHTIRNYGKVSAGPPALGGLAVRRFDSFGLERFEQGQGDGVGFNLNLIT